MSTKKAVIFDFGGVFIDSPFAALSAAAIDRGLEPEVLALAVFGAYDQDTDHPWHRLERGEITITEARGQIMADHALPDGSPLDPFDLLTALAGGGAREEMVEFCRDLGRRGVRTSLLTNNAKEFEEFWMPLLPLDELFEDVVDSSAVGMRKPAPGIYRLALERLGLERGAGGVRGRCARQRDRCPHGGNHFGADRPAAQRCPEGDRDSRSPSSPVTPGGGAAGRFGVRLFRRR